MHLVDILIDSRVSCEFIDAKGTENVIFCRPFEESIHNVTALTTRSSEFIHNFITESNGDNYLITDIELPTGEKYNNVRFKIIACEEAEIPHSTVDISALGTPSSIDSTQQRTAVISEDIQYVDPLVESEEITYPEYVRGSFDPILIEQAKALEAKLINQQQELQQKEEQLKRRQSIVEVNEKLQKTLEDYKSELLTEYYTAHEKQKDILTSQLSDVSTSLFEYLGEKIKDQKTDAIELLKELSNSNLKQLQEDQNLVIEKLKTEINTLLSEKIETNSNDVDKLLVERSGELQQLFSEKIVLELESHKKRVEEEIESITYSLNHLIGEKLTENNFEIDKRFINRSSEIHTQFTEELNTELTSFKSTLLEAAQTQSTDITNKLFVEQFNTLSEILDEHKGTLNTVVSEKLTDIQKLITDFNSDTDKNHSLQLEELKHAFTSLVNDHKDDLNQIVSKKIIDTKEEISKFTDKFEAQVPVLEERLTGIEALINEHRESLNNAAKQKIDEVSDIVKTFADEVQGRIPGLDSKIVEITEHIDTLIKEKKDIQAIVDNNKQYTTTVVNKGVQEAKDYARRILELGGGGGSVAVQYANGGTMNGDLNVTGQYLSAGVSLFNILSGSGNQPYTLVDVTNSIQPVRGSNIASGAYSFIGGGASNNTNSLDNTFILGSNITASLSDYTYVNNLSSQGIVTAAGGNSTNWNTAYNTSTAYQTASSSFATNTLLQSTSALLTPLTTTNTLTSQLVLNTTLNSLSGNWQNAYTSWNAASATSVVAFNDTRFARLSSQAYTLVDATSSIQPARGVNNTASGNYSNILGGCGNFATGCFAVVANGTLNGATGTFSVVGGRQNRVCANFGIIAGGQLNIITASGYNATIAGGVFHRATGVYSTIVGGNSGQATGGYTFIGAGRNNSASGYTSSVVGGCLNTASGNCSTVVAGASSLASGCASFIGSGACNTASGNYSFIAGGANNNTGGFANTFILGTALSANQANYTYVNNLSSQGIINARDGIFTGQLSAVNQTSNNASSLMTRSLTDSRYSTLQQLISTDDYYSQYKMSYFDDFIAPTTYATAVATVTGSGGSQSITFNDSFGDVLNTTPIGNDRLTYRGVNQLQVSGTFNSAVLLFPNISLNHNSGSSPYIKEFWFRMFVGATDPTAYYRFGVNPPAGGSWTAARLDQRALCFDRTINGSNLFYAQPAGRTYTPSTTADTGIPLLSGIWCNVYQTYNASSTVAATLTSISLTVSYPISGLSYTYTFSGADIAGASATSHYSFTSKGIIIGQQDTGGGNFARKAIAFDWMYWETGLSTTTLPVLSNWNSIRFQR